MSGVGDGGAERRRGAERMALPAPVPQSGVRNLPIAVVVAEVRGLGFGAGEPRRAGRARLVREVCAALTDVAVERRASIDAVEGVGFRFFYGATNPRHDDTLQALLTAMALQRTFLALRNLWMQRADPAAGTLALGVGVAAGRASLRRGRGAESVLQLSGRPLKRAAQLGEAARPLEVLVDAQALASIGRGLDEYVQFTPRRVRPRNARPSIAYRAQAKRASLRLVRKG